ncbi:MAG TPA: hypothetical protein VNT20_04175 [Flavisolibacter sp.]|jgi:hypothetical protein|nr:hypothetical protein [Flavisolibacter sp.]
MAKVVKSIILKGLSGRIGEYFVVKQYKGKTIVSKYPDMRAVERSRKQRKNNQKFRNAVRYAQAVMGNEKLIMQYKKKVKKGQSVFHYLIGEYMKRA